MPFVVDRDRPPLPAVPAVVDERDERRRHLLADPVLEDARVLLDVVGFEAVATRLVEQHPTGAALQHDRDAHNDLFAGDECLEIDVKDLTLDRVALDLANERL